MRWIVGVVLLVIVAAAFRLPDLATRPMHTDEAVNAVIANDLHQRAKYRYDPVEHHGPTLPFLTLPVLAAFEVRAFDEMTESQLRGVTALCGVLLVLVLALARPLLGTGATLATMLWLAVSPAAVYYSRYYIHEMLLVTFTTLAWIAYGRATLRPTAETDRPVPAPLRATPLWWILCGVSLGAMHATKETFVIAVGAAGLATVLTAWWERSTGASALATTSSRARRWVSYGATLVAATLVSYALFSFFGANPRGPANSILTFETYLGRATGGGNTDHVQPWWSYLTLLGYQYRAPFHWSEAAIALFGLVGIVAAFRASPGDASSAPGHRSPPDHANPDRVTPDHVTSDRADSHRTTVRRRTVRFLAIYALAMTVAYSAIPYKTPWCLLEFWVPWMALAGVGVNSVVRAAWSATASQHARLLLRAGSLAVVAIAASHLAVQAYRASFVLPSSLRNPYVYAHPVPGVIKLSDYIHALRALPDPTESRPPIAVISDHPWPLPWYLRDDRVGYWTAVDAAAQHWGSHVPEIIVTDESLADRLAQALPLDYARNTYGHRPGIRFVLFVHPELRARFVVQAQEGSR